MPDSTAIFQNRTDAGRQLAAILASYHDVPNLLALGLPRGGVVVAFEVAESLDAPLDVFVVRKIGVPGHEELAMGAIASGGVVVVNHSVLHALDIQPDLFEAAVVREREELIRRETLYRNHRPPPEIQGRTVILVDDGLATGASMQAAIEGLRVQQPRDMVVAVPVAAVSTYEKLRPMVSDLVCVATPEPFYGVGQWYHDFAQTTDTEVRELLEKANRRTPHAA
jgi:predicted phosphoribosyltransferase